MVWTTAEQQSRASSTSIPGLVYLIMLNAVYMFSVELILNAYFLSVPGCSGGSCCWNAGSNWSLFIPAGRHHKPVSNQSNQQSITEQNAAVQYEKKKHVITMEDITSLICRSQPRLPGTTKLRPFNMFKEKHRHTFIYPTSFIGTGTKDSLALNCLPKAMLSCSNCSDWVWF